MFFHPESVSGVSFVKLGLDFRFIFLNFILYSTQQVAKYSPQLASRPRHVLASRQIIVVGSVAMAKAGQNENLAGPIQKSRAVTLTRRLSGRISRI